MSKGNDTLLSNMTPSRAGKKILVADDSLTIQKVIRLALSNEGYEIQAVSDGPEAMQQIAVFRPDVVLIDVSLPGLTAFEVKEQINGEPDSQHTRFILMSSAFESVDEEKALEVRFHGRLTKPFDPAHLRQVLNQVLSQPAVTNELDINATSRDDELPSVSRSIFESPVESGEVLGLTPPPRFGANETLTGTSFSIPPMPELPSTPAGDELWGSAPETETDAPNETDPFSEFSGETTDFSATNDSGSLNDDIRGLTESTIRMSGLDEVDDFEWKVNDSAKRLSPSSAPPSSISPAFQFNPELTTTTSAPSQSDGFAGNASYAEPTLTPPPGMNDLSGVTYRTDVPASQKSKQGPLKTWPPSHLLEDEDHTPLQENAYFTPAHVDSPHSSTSREEPPRGPSPSPNPAANALDVEALEAMIERQVRETLERMAQKILPEVAERIIKQEIHRMLQETP